MTRSLSEVIGGVERQLGNIARRLSESGHVVTILSSDAEKPKVFYSQLDQFSIKTYGPTVTDSSSLMVQRVQRQRNIFRLIVREKPDLVIGFMLSGFLAALPTSKLVGIPIILAERNSPDVYNLTRAKKFKNLYFQLMRASSGITVQLEIYKSRYPKYLQDRIKVIYNEILVTPSDLNKKKNSRPFTFGFVGRFSYQKQPISLIDSFARHVTEGNDSRLLFIGRGELESEMKKRISDLELGDRVRIMEPLQDLDKIYNSLDVLCIPSLWEGIPNVVGEAMRYGIPILGNQNCLGLSELVSPETGC